MKDIANYDGQYKICKNGKVWSSITEKYLSPAKTSGGYYTVSLYKNKKSKTHYIHRLLAEAFIANPDNMPCINHIDGIKDNNDLSNLEWCSYSENNRHAYSNGLSKKGNLRYNSKLRENHIKSVFMLSRIGLSQEKISRMFGVSRGSIQDVLDGKSWVHTGEYDLSKKGKK